MNRTLYFIITLCLLLTAAWCSAAEDMTPAAIEQRIQAIGKVYTQEQQPPAAQTPSPTDTPAAKPVKLSVGEQVYNKACGVCHANGLAGAPKPGNKAAWAPRQQKGMAALLNNVINGYNAMPPKGTCMDCSNDDFIAAIKFMLPK